VPSTRTGPVAVSLDSTPVIEAYKEHVDRTLLRENLRLTTTQRIEKMMRVLAFAEAIRGSRREAAGS
jgi:hypothetical protein